MTRHNKLFAALAAMLLAASVTGCNGVFNGQVSDNSVKYYGTAVMHANITNYKEVILDSANKNDVQQRQASAARTITPTVSASRYDFYLYGEMGTNHWGPTKIDSANIAGGNGTFDFEMEYGQWNLVLAVVETGTTAPDSADFAGTSMLLAKDYVDLTKKNDVNVDFKLSPEGLSHTGTVNFNIYLKGWTLKDEMGTGKKFENLEIKAYLANITTGAEVSATVASTEDASTPLTIAVDGKGTPETTDDEEYINYTAKGQEVAPGIYNFVLDFILNGKVIFSYSQDLMVFPFDVTDENISIPHLFNAIPGAPSYLHASVKVAVDDPYTPENKQTQSNTYAKDSQSYQVKFDWDKYDADSNEILNETNFELQIAEISGVAGKKDAAFTLNMANGQVAPTDANPVFWDEANKEVSFVKLSGTNTNDAIGDATVTGANAWSSYDMNVVRDTSMYVTGSLNANSESITLFLPLGKEYTARIRSVNPSGESAWTYVSLTGFTEASGYKLFAGKTINNYSIKYYLNSGEAGSIKGTYHEVFGPVDAKGVEYWDAYDDRSASGLNKGGVYVTGWTKLDTDGSTVIAAPVSTPAADVVNRSATDKAIPAAYTTKGYNEGMKEVIVQEKENGTVVTTTKYYYSKATGTAIGDPATVTDWKFLGGLDDIDSVVESLTTLDSYYGYENLELYAQYSKKLNWSFVTDVKLDVANLQYQVGDNASTWTTAANLTNDYSLEYDPSDGNYIRWTLPACEVGKEFDYIKATVKTADGNATIISTTKLDNVSTAANNTLVSYVGSCTSGSRYLIEIEAGLPYSDLTDTITLVLIVQ